MKQTNILKQLEQELENIETILFINEMSDDLFYIHGGNPDLEAKANTLRNQIKELSL